jgi:hypothetical protein
MNQIPLIFDQDIKAACRKISYLKTKNKNVFSIGAVFPHFSSKYDIPTTISPLSFIDKFVEEFGETDGLDEKEIELHLLCFNTEDDLDLFKASPDSYIYKMIPKNWKIHTYAKTYDGIDGIKTPSNIITGCHIPYSEFCQDTLDALKVTGSKDFYLFDDLLSVDKKEWNFDTIKKLITSNSDTNFLVSLPSNYSSDSFIETIGDDVKNCILVLNKVFWNNAFNKKSIANI